MTRNDNSDGGNTVAPSAARDEPADFAASRRKPEARHALATVTYGLIAATIIVPIGYLFYAAFQTGAPLSPDSEFTWSNVTKVLSTPRYRTALWNSLKLSMVVAPIAVTIGAALGWVVTRTDVPARRLLSILVPFPLFLSPFAAGVAWVILGTEASGLINIAYRSVTGSDGALVNIYSFAGLAWVMILVFIPYGYLFLVAAMRNIGGELEEASRIGGASIRMTMLRVSIPMTIPAITSAFLLVFVLSAEMFSVPSVIGGPAGYPTLPYRIYRSTTSAPADWSGAAAAGFVFVLVMAVGVVLQRRATRLSAKYVSVSGKGISPSKIRLGRWRWWAFGCTAAYIFLALILPWSTLLLATFMRYFTPEFDPSLLTFFHWENILGSRELVEAISNTLSIAFVGPTLAVVLALVLVYLWRRTKIRLGGLVETIATVPVAIPGIVFGVGVLWAYIKTPLYGTVILLVVAYVGRYLPYPLRTLSSSIVQYHRDLDDASRIAGAGLVRTMRSISLPLLRPAAFSAWMLLFIIMTRELNVAVMVTTGSSIVLPVMMWGQLESGVFQGAAIVAFFETGLIIAAYLVATLVLKVDLVEGRSE